MKILILSFYFEPDLSAGSFRNTALVKELMRQLPEGSKVDVVTTLPNRYATFSAEASELELINGVEIQRAALPVHQSGMVDQSKAFFSYAKCAVSFVADKQYDLVYASSSRLMTAVLGAKIARQKKIPLYLDIRDIFVDTIKDVLPKSLTWLMKPVFSQIEKWTIRSASKVNVVSEGFVPYFKQRYSNLPMSVFTNGIDDTFLHVQPQSSAPVTQAVIKVLYAGNMGEGQGLHNIIPKLAKRLEGKVEFTLIGAGGRLEQLKLAIASMGCNNVKLRPPVQRDDLIAAYQDADVLFLHLNDYDAFEKVLPSKLFEYAAMGKPIWAGISGFAAEFVKNNISNSSIFSPCDDTHAEKALAELSITTEPRHSFVDRFSRAKIMRDMVADIIQIASDTR